MEVEEFDGLGATCDDLDVDGTSSKRGINVTPELVGNLIAWLTDYQFPIRYQDDNEELHITGELFIWALLHDRQELAKKLWSSLGRDYLAYGLMASLILKSLSKKTGNKFTMMHRSQILKELSEDYEQCCRVLLTKCYKEDPNQAHFLLWRIQPKFGNQNIIRQCFSSELSKFLEHDCCQSSITNEWYQRIPENTSWWKILVCSCLPFLLSLLIQLKPPYKEQVRPGTEKDRQLQLSLLLSMLLL